MKMYHFSKEKFMRQVENSKDAIFLHFPDGEICDLKSDRSAAKWFGLMDVPDTGIEVSTANPADTMRLVQLMMEDSGQDKKYA